MGWKDYFILLSIDDELRVRIITEAGRVIEFMVQYEAIIDGQRHRVVRYDTAHGDPHRDLLDADGHTIEKHWLPGWDFGVALQEALRDLRTHWPQYRADFIRRRP